jgi:hypothetical protein
VMVPAHAPAQDGRETFVWLDRAWCNRSPDLSWLLYGPLILRYKDDPRFIAFCRKVGLPMPGGREASALSRLGRSWASFGASCSGARLNSGNVARTCSGLVQQSRCFLFSNRVDLRHI